MSSEVFIKIWPWSAAPEEYKALFIPREGWRAAWVIFSPAACARFNWPWDVETALAGGPFGEGVRGLMGRVDYPMKSQVHYQNNGLDTIAILLVEEGSPWVT